MVKITLRNAQPIDEDNVIALWRASGLVVSYNDPAADFRFAQAAPGSDILVGQDAKGDIIGTVMVGHDGHRGWLYYVASDPASRGRGVGRQMVQAAEGWLRERGIRKVQLMVRETNTTVASFSEHLGFEVSPRILMAKWLDQPPEQKPDPTS